MRWRKLGLVYAPDGRLPWAKSHAMIPTPLMLSDETVRLYVAHADEKTVSRIGYLDVALSDPTRVIGASDQPLLDIGAPGTFDDNGVNACCVVSTEDEVRLYYGGYQLHRNIPYTLFTGLAIAPGPDGPFNRVSQTPILERRDGELFFRTAPFVLRENGAWRMWYIGGSGWIDANGKILPKYSLRHIRSDDGMTWHGPSTECMAPVQPGEIGFGRPFIVPNGDQYRMWYSIRSTTGYRIGYAVSRDGLAWERRDGEAGIETSPSGWDSEMICYSAIVRAGNRQLMFYNGNGYGRTGVGVAVADTDE